VKRANIELVEALSHGVRKSAQNTQSPEHYPMNTSTHTHTLLGRGPRPVITDVPCIECNTIILAKDCIAGWGKVQTCDDCAVKLKLRRALQRQISQALYDYGRLVDLSPGHLGWQLLTCGTLAEVFILDGMVYRAKLSDAFDVTTKCRQGRFQCTVDHWNRYGAGIVLGEGFSLSSGA